MNILKSLPAPRLRYLWILLGIQSILVTIYIHVTFNPFLWRWEELKNPIYGDELSYLHYPFTSLHAMLDHIRSPGLPLALHAYKYFFSTYQYWPHVQMAMYVSSLFFLFWAFYRTGFNRILSFIIVSCLLWNIDWNGTILWFQFYRHLIFLDTEFLCLAWLHITLGCMLFAIKKDTWKLYLLFGINLFFLYQIRPNVSYMALLAPFWAVGFASIWYGWNSNEMTRIFLRSVLMSIVPLFCFGFLRMIVIGQFGFSTMTGGTLAGHATYFLNEQNITILSGETRVIAEKILAHKRKISYPCNVTPFYKIMSPNQTLTESQAKCFGPDLTLAWAEVIKYESGREPTDNPTTNLETWDTVPWLLADFHANNYHISTDKILMKFSKEILAHEWRQYLSWIFYGGVYGMQLYFIQEGMIVWYWIVGMVIIIVQLLLKARVFGILDTTQWYRQLRAFSFFAGSNAIAGYILLLLFNFPFDRMFFTFMPYIIPMFVIWAVPPVWLKYEKKH